MKILIDTQAKTRQKRLRGGGVSKLECSDVHKEANERLITPLEMCKDTGKMLNRNLDINEENNPKRLKKILQNIRYIAR